MIFGNNTIKKRILATLNAMIDEAQSNYDTAVKELDDRCQEAHEELDVELVLRKASEADRLVDSIVGRLK